MILKNIIITCMAKICNSFIISAFTLCFLTNCGDRDTSIGKDVECCLYWVSDTYPIETKYAKEHEMRFISMHFIIINNASESYFLPINNCGSISIDSMFCSKISASIGEKPLYTWFSIDNRWDGILKPADSIRASLKIPERLLDSVRVDRRIRLTELLDMLDIRYDRCLSDTVYSTFPISQLRFTKNDSIVVRYRDTIYIMHSERNFPRMSKHYEK